MGVEDKNKYSILNVDYVKYKTLLTKKFVNRKFYKDPEIDKLYSFISGTIKNIYVKNGTRIAEGDDLLMLEAMKMNNIIKSPVNGKVKKIHVKPGERVPKDKLLIEFIIDE